MEKCNTYFMEQMENFTGEFEKIKEKISDYLKKLKIRHDGDSRKGSHSYASWTDYYTVLTPDGRSFATSDLGQGVGRKIVNALVDTRYLNAEQKKELDSIGDSWWENR